MPRSSERSSETGFPESLKREIRNRANGRCCICGDIPVDIHHIVPTKDGGDDTETNAAPLCPSCHRKYGNNPDHRKMIREMRDAHYRKCGTRDIAGELAGIQAKLDSHTEALARLESMGLARVPIRLDDTEYSFAREEFVHPLIVLELLGWISDSDETICSVDLCTANKSNRFHGEFSTDHVDGRTWVRGRRDNGPDEPSDTISYAHVATTHAGTELVQCYTCGGGSGVFGYVAAFRVTKEEVLFGRNRIALTILGSVGLGDRYDGSIRYDGRFLKIGPDRGWFNRGEEAERKFRVS